ncbi:aminoglycoside phosphotransferase family protein [Azovibrio restrictus]|uniref:aminoglycoside phosphotransferase family protein n=1 Tax=Azovibrio restrictus TaxID=146938 RepID=UPI0026ED1997|nr:phosphotransferase [Azovibrio restrictus]
MSRDEQLQAWVAQHLAHRYPGAEIGIAPASADASFRRYFRLSLPDGSTRILMDAPPDKEDCRPFVQVAGLLAEAGIHGPKVEIEDLENGFLVLTDLGRIGYLAALNAEPALADILMRPVLDVLVRWQLASRPDVLPPYDEALLRREMNLFPEWYIGRHLGRELHGKQRQTLENVFRLLVDSALAQPRVFVHRDFMPRNLMVVESEAQLTPGVLDFQDAVYGPITYDVVSLFRDAFISWEEEQEIDWVVRYWEKARDAGLPVHADFGEFWQAYEWMGLQRHLKVLGIFCRLKYRDGKENYITDLPRFLGYARKVAGRYAALKPLLMLLDELEDRPLETGLTF